MTASAPESSSAANRILVRARPELMRLADFACGRWLAGTDSPQLAYGIDRLQARARLLLAQEQLLKEGEPQDALYLVRRGALKSSRLDSVGDEQVLDFHFAGDLIGRSALSGAPQGCNVTALRDSELCVFQLDTLEQAMLEVPDLQRRVLAGIGRAIAHDHDHALLLGRTSAQDRLACFVLGLHQRQTARGESTSRIELPMRRAEIASYVGLVIETVSRAFTRLRNERLLRVAGRQIQILDIARLQALCGQGDCAASTLRGLRQGH